METPVDQRRSSCLPMQLLRVETHSFLPDGQSDGGNLSCQGKTGHRRPHPFGNPSRIEIVQGARTRAGRDGSTFEETLQIFIVIVIQTAHCDALAVALQFASHTAVLATVVSLDRETAVGPKL